MRQAEYFIEQYNSAKTGRCYHSSNPLPISQLKTVLGSTVNIRYMNTVAIFKIYPKVEPMLAHYDNDLKSVIIE